MSRIDELQAKFNLGSQNISLGKELVKNWETIYRALCAAKELACCTADDIDSRLDYVMVAPDRKVW